MEGAVIIDMKDKYPFGQLKEASQENGIPLVRKQLKYQGPEQLELIKKMVGLLSQLKHPQIIKLESYEL